MKTVVVTGGSGYVGGFVVADLLNHGYAVRTSVRNEAKARQVQEELVPFVSKERLGHLSFFIANLTSRAGWQEGFTGAYAVLHVASPIGKGIETRQELIDVATNGTLNVLQAVAAARVPHVVMTGSQAAATPPRSAGAMTVDESYWTDTTNPDLIPYYYSKVAAERAAWTFSKYRPFTLTVLLPGAIFGPLMNGRVISSNSLLLGLLNGQETLPNVPMEVNDVRDLAILHRLALANPTAYGERYISGTQRYSLPQVAQLYHDHFPALGINVRSTADTQIRTLAKVHPKLRQVLPLLGTQFHHTNAKVRTALKWHERGAEQTLLDAAQSLIDFGLVNK